MKERTPSATAAHVAVHRAIESAKSADRRICYDPFAKQFLSPRATVFGETWIPSSAALWVYERMFTGFHTYFAVRTRYLDDHLRTCIGEGIEQLVLLGAGYDSRAYRFEQLKRGVNVFEVDHPATQQEKLAKLQNILGSTPSHVTYVSVDFSKESVAERLLQSGYSKARKTLFIWEGVTYYLTPEAVDNTLLFVSKNSQQGSSILFDYTEPSVVTGTSPLREAKSWRRVVQGFGEPLTFGIEITMIDRFLTQRGFRNVHNSNHDDLRNKYLTGANRHRYLSPVFALVHAEIDA